MSEGFARLSDRRAKHIRDIHRVQVGDCLRVGIVNGQMGEGRVEALSETEIVLSVAVDRPAPSPLGIDLLLALPRPKILKKVLPAVTSMGVKQIVLVNSARVDKSYFTTPMLQPEGLRELLVLGLEQARDTVLPEVLIRHRFRPFVEDEIEGVWRNTTSRLIAHPGVDGTVEQLSIGRTHSIVVAIGPEGGWVPFELELLEKQGFRSFSLGDRILRVDTAVPSILSQLDLVRRLGVGGP